MIAANLREWRSLVLERDNKICQICGEAGTVADHILPRNLDKSMSIAEATHGLLLKALEDAKNGKSINEQTY